MDKFIKLGLKQSMMIMGSEVSELGVWVTPLICKPPGWQRCCEDVGGIVDEDETSSNRGPLVFFFYDSPKEERFIRIPVELLPELCLKRWIQTTKGMNCAMPPSLSQGRTC